MSAEEIFDVVDGADRVVECLPRSEVHARGLRHRAAHILVYDRDGRLYVQRRSFAKECSPGRWDTSAAGHLNSGEDYHTAAVRELGEELGLVATTPLEPLFKIDASPATGHEFVWVYRHETDAEVRPDPAEIIDGRWCEASEIEAWLAREPESFTGSFHLIWPRVRGRSA
jgi:isopentenyldiphosphate isomerase